MKTTKKLIGHCGVDAGMLIILDPCYVKREKLLTDPEKWQEFCDTYYKENPGNSKEMCNGVIFNTRNGDGNFPVYAHYNKEGELLRVEVSFTGRD